MLVTYAVGALVRWPFQHRFPLWRCLKLCQQLLKVGVLQLGPRWCPCHCRQPACLLLNPIRTDYSLVRSGATTAFEDVSHLAPVLRTQLTSSVLYARSYFRHTNILLITWLIMSVHRRRRRYWNPVNTARLKQLVRKPVVARRQSTSVQSVSGRSLAVIC